MTTTHAIYDVDFDDPSDPMSRYTIRYTTTVHVCPSPTNADECAMIRERAVAGVNAPIPACPIHGEWSDA